MISTKFKILIEEFSQDVRMGNCFKLYAGKELIGIFPSELAINLMVDMLAECMPITAGNAKFRFCIAYIPDFK